MLRPLALGAVPSLLLLGALLAGACSDDDPTTAVAATGGGDGGSTSTSATGTTSTGGAGGAGGGETANLDEAYCTPLAELLCARATDCGCAAAFPAGLDEALCVESYRATCLTAYAAIAAAAEAGDARIDAVNAAACITLIASSTPACEAPRGTVPLGLCPAWFASDEALGAPCTFPVCAEGEGSCRDGECVARPGEGDECSGDECAPGLLCLEGTCAAPGDADAPCALDDACTPPLRCIAGACGALLAEEAACTEASECAAGLVCDETCATPTAAPCAGEGDCGNLALCAVPRACRPPGELDEPCTQTEDCQPGYGCAEEACALLPGDGDPCADGVGCGPDLACNVDTSLCAPLPGVGQPCALGTFGPFLCDTGLGCSDPGTCATLPGLGDPCTIDSRCEAGLGCAFGPEGSTCIEPKQAGGTCENDATCASALHCGPGGTCQADVATGAPCLYGNECTVTDTCTPDAGGTFRCAPLPAEGEPCLFDCDGGLVCTSVPTEAVCVPAICDAL